MPRVLFLGLCLNFHYFSTGVVFPQFGFDFSRRAVAQALVERTHGQLGTRLTDLTEELTAEILRAGVTEIKVRSVLTCQTPAGVCPE